MWQVRDNEISLRNISRGPVYLRTLEPGTELLIGQTGHGLGPRAFGGPAQRSFLWRLNVK